MAHRVAGVELAGILRFKNRYDLSDVLWRAEGSFPSKWFVCVDTSLLHLPAHTGNPVRNRQNESNGSLGIKARAKVVRIIR
jgi:hypothetical protein